MDDSKCGIYSIRCRRNGRVYVGSAVWIAKRWRGHREALRKGKHHSRALQSSWNKYGEAAFDFEVLEIVDDRENLIAREQVHIDALGASGRRGFNMASLAGSNLGLKHGATARKHMSEAAMGRRASPETRALLSAGLMGNTRRRGLKSSPETIAKLKAAQVGRAPSLGHKPSLEWRRMISELHRGVPKGEEHRRRISESLKGKPKSNAHAAKLSESQRRLDENQVTQIRTMISEGRTLTSIAADFKVSISTISNVKHGKKSAYKNASIQRKIDTDR
jgi:group I intron endonuclease